MQLACPPKAALASTGRLPGYVIQSHRPAHQPLVWLGPIRFFSPLVLTLVFMGKKKIPASENIEFFLQLVLGGFLHGRQLPSVFFRLLPPIFLPLI